MFSLVRSIGFASLRPVALSFVHPLLSLSIRSIHLPKTDLPTVKSPSIQSFTKSSLVSSSSKSFTPNKSTNKHKEKSSPEPTNEKIKNQSNNSVSESNHSSLSYSDSSSHLSDVSPPPFPHPSWSSVRPSDFHSIFPYYDSSKHSLSHLLQSDKFFMLTGERINEIKQRAKVVYRLFQSKNFTEISGSLMVWREPRLLLIANHSLIHRVLSHRINKIKHLIGGESNWRSILERNPSILLLNDSSLTQRFHQLVQLFGKSFIAHYFTPQTNIFNHSPIDYLCPRLNILAYLIGLDASETLGLCRLNPAILLLRWNHYERLKILADKQFQRLYQTQIIQKRAEEMKQLASVGSSRDETHSKFTAINESTVYKDFDMIQSILLMKHEEFINNYPFWKERKQNPTVDYPQVFQVAATFAKRNLMMKNQRLQVAKQNETDDLTSEMNENDVLDDWARSSTEQVKPPKPFPSVKEIKKYSVLKKTSSAPIEKYGKGRKLSQKTLRHRQHDSGSVEEHS
jgi:hypothetical protein